MPQITSNDDGSQTFTVNSHELKGIGDAFGNVAHDLDKVLEVVDSPEFRAALNFVKSISDR